MVRPAKTPDYGQVRIHKLNRKSLVEDFWEQEHAWGTTIREKSVKSLPEGRKQPNPLRSDEVKRILNALEEYSR